MAQGGKFELTIQHAQLVRKFDTIKCTQDVYVALVRNLPNGNDVEFARTATCNSGDLRASWQDEKFVVSQAGGTVLKLKVYVQHFWRTDTKCGDGLIAFDAAFASIAQGQVAAMDLPMYKGAAKTGSLRILLSRCRDASAAAMAAAAPPLLSMAPASPEEYKAELVKLLNRPEELEEKVLGRFRQIASPAAGGRLAVRPEDCGRIRQMLSERLGVPSEVFGEINQMFWRFEVAGQGLLFEDEATRMILCMLRNYRDSLQGPTAHAQLGRNIRTQPLASAYDVSKELGRGGQGIAMLAKSWTSGQEVVVKMYAKTNQKEAVEDISREFELLMSLKHPKIARVFEIFQDWDNVYIVQEPYFGGDLSTAVQHAYKAGVAVDERWVARVMYQVLMGVEFLHTNGVVHSDLKEPNVMVASHEDWRNPQVIVIDFGLANKFSSRSGVGGTPGYMPPEVWDWGLWTPRGDVFSIGVMIFNLRTGKSPFNPDYRRSLDDIKQLTKTAAVEMERGSAEVKSIVRSMLHKQFLARPLVSQIMKDPWFQSQEQGQAIDTSALENLARQGQRTELYRALLADVAARQNLAQLRELNETFMRLDVNNDGSISAKEMREGLRGLWQPDHIERLVSALGLEDGGQVSYDEFVGELMAARAPEENAMLQRLFTEADSQRRGYLGMAELAELAKRPALVKVFGSEETAMTKMRSLDSNQNGRVTFDEFKLALQGGPRASAAAGGYKQGQSAKYWSASHGVWIPCMVTDVDGARGAVVVDCKPGFWLAGKQLRLLRPAGAREPSGYREGQGVLMWSTTFSAWLPCRITCTDQASGAVQVDAKPGYWLRGNELATRIKPAATGAPLPPPNGGVGSAARAGAGRQLLHLAVGGVGADRR